MLETELIQAILGDTDNLEEIVIEWLDMEELI
jgi:hypothetical protein